MRSKTAAKALATVAAAMLLATGCSGSSTEASGSGGSDEPVKLTYWTWTPNMDQVVAKWNEQNPDVQVTVNKQDGGDAAVTKLLTAIKAGSGAPDIMQAEYQAVPTLVAADALADISEELDGDVADKFPESAWEAVTLGSDAVYGVPQDSGPMMFFYRADLFEQYGIEVPTTWDEYAEAARKIKAADPSKFLGTFSAADPGWFTGLSQQVGASWWGVDGDTWQVDVDSEATKKVASYWGGLVEEGVIDNTPMYTPEWNAALNDGTQVAWLGAVWGPGVLEGNAESTKGKWKVAPLPNWDAATPANGNWGGSATSVTSQSKHPEAATEFITWLNTDPEAVKLLAGTANVYPAATDARANALTEPPAFFADQPDFYDIAAEAAEAANPFTYGPNVNVAYSAYKDAFGKAAEAKSAAEFPKAVEAVQETTVEDMQNSGFNVEG
ncbi:multiple sugar transport system substrate-binding protein [Kineococcus xinjiangensis]|uniref:Multiple sugar transport system substrate-binding protein n=1 Tax=Kineococcus xinjiangensis TaxID=512762 RepID=A0A2S6IW05_9ACTN|nr:sugar ABC transporter substrate-binding protein [Kineococcus xinjiangensis]PPK98420.1 multiple sugar transport system substrate-binding protein [Kineococcus xinjiangensis]